MNVLTWPLRHPHVAVVLASLSLVLGAHSLLTMPRQDTPSISVNKALVAAFLPGATTVQMEQQLTRPLEAYLFTFAEIDATKSQSVIRDGQVVVTVELHDWVKDKEGFWSRLRLGLSELKQTRLPAATRGPLVNSDFGQSVALLIAVTSSRHGFAELRRIAERIEEVVRAVPDAGRIKRQGDRRESIYVEADSQRLAQYGVGLPQVLAALKLQNREPSSGSIKVWDNETPLHTVGRFTSLEAVRQQVVLAEPPAGGVIRIEDVARVERRIADADSLLRVNGREDSALLLSVEMQPGRNIVAFGRRLDEALAEARRQLPSGVELHVINDQPAVVSVSVAHFIREFFIAVAAVIAVALLLLPLRVAAVAAMAIPVTIAITFKVLEWVRVELHEVSLASLIVVLGMVVDDAIVIADNYVEKLDEGFGRWEAAWKSAAELVVPVLTATLAIILAFAPLGFFLSGSVGEFIVALPVTVAIALTVSFAVAMFLTPLLCHAFIHRGLSAGGHSFGANALEIVQGAYQRVMGPLMRRPVATLVVAFLSLPAGLLLLPATKQKFFPAAERAQFVVEVDLPLGTRLDATDAVVRQVEQSLRADPRITEFAAFIGHAAPRVYYSFAPEFPRPSYGMLLVNVRSDAEAQSAVRDYADKLSRLHPPARINVVTFQQGIPTEAPVELRIAGPELDVLRTLGDEVAGLLLRSPLATQVRDDFRDGFSIDVRVNGEVANRLGLTTSMLAADLEAGFRGVTATDLWEHDDAIPIVLRLSEENRSAFGDLEQLNVRAPFSPAAVPLRQVARIEPVWNAAQIVRRGGVRTLTVRASPVPDVLPSQVLASVRAELARLDLPPGYRLEIGGEREGQAETFAKMARALVASIVLIYLVLLFQFKGTREALLVMLAIPLTFFGAMAGLVLTSNPLGFTAAVGLISLVGIVIRNSIILVDYADELRRKSSFDAETAARQAGERRLRPIFLTSMAAAAGVLPMVVSGSPLWAPLASVFSVGIVWSMVTTLLVVPCAYLLALRGTPVRSPQPASPSS